MDTSNPTPPKKGLGPLAWLGIGCGGLVVLGIIVFVILGVLYGGKLKEFGEEAQRNPTKAAVTVALKVGAGRLELVAEDDVNKRYTMKDKTTGQLTTLYWDAQQNKAVTVQGDFSAIPPQANPAATPAPAP